MATAFCMPKNGMDMTEGTLVRWLKEEGDHVEKDEPIVEIETDKVTMEAESPVSGILLKKLYADGDVVPVLTEIAYIGEANETVPEAGKAAAPAASAAAAPAQEEKGGKEDFTVAVIGGGPAGYVAAIRAAQLGAKVALFEKDTLGGTCLNRGCIPTKSFLKTAEHLHHIKQFAERGIQFEGTVSVDMPTIVKQKNSAVTTLTNGVGALLRSNHVTVIKGVATLASANSIACEGNVYTAKKIILCGGSQSAMIPIPGIDHPAVVSSTELLDAEEVPARLCIIGGGVIGCELATAFRAFGSDVTVVEKMDTLVPVMDTDITKLLKQTMEKDGIKIYLGEGVVAIEGKPDGSAVLKTEKQEIPCDKILVAVGRKPDLECLGAMADQIKVERGRIIVDDTMKTSVDNIYACGDVNGRLMLAHAAFHMGEVAAENCVTGKNAPCKLNCVPNVLYTLPEAAGVGLTEAEAKKQYQARVKVGKFPFAANGRALVSGCPEGFVKVVVDAQYGEILGVHMIGGAASEMIAEAAALMKTEITVDEVVSEIVHAHPSYSEAFYEACADALGRCIHLPAKS